MLSLENTNTINSLSFKQVARLWRHCGYRGDYMKKGGIAVLRDDIRAHYARITSGDICNEQFAQDIAAAFPQGVYAKGAKRSYNRASTTASNSVEATTADTSTTAESFTDGHIESTASVPTNDQDKALALLKTLLGGNQTVNQDQVRAIVRKELEGLVLPVTVQISTDKADPVKLEGVHHRRFADLLAKVQAGVNVWLAGPAGTGKTTAAHNVAKALGLPFYFNGAIDNEYKLLGFTDAQGRIVSRPFRQAYLNGGVYLFDEVDASMPSALLAFNAAMANGHCDFPDGCFERHADFRVIAAANTYGQGATADYVGRNRMDGAFLDRFVMQAWEIDETLERTIAGHDRWVSYVQRVRAKIAAKGIKIIVSPRASINGAKMLAAGISWEECQDSCLRRGMSDEQWQGVN